MLEPDSDSDDDIYEENFVRDFNAEASVISENLLPQKSSKRYKLAYEYFIRWKDINGNKTVINENMLLVYFKDLAERLKPSTMWSVWSMLRSTLLVNNQIDLDTYSRLKSFLKIKNKGYKKKKAPGFTAEQVKKFMTLADDHIYLAIKVILIFGFCGGMRTCEFTNLAVKDVVDSGNHFMVSIEENKNDYPRTFLIGQYFYDVVKKYILLRPNDMDLNRFFIHYEKGKCTRQAIGKNTFGGIPNKIALFLNIDNPERFTGHGLRRTAATLFANSGANNALMKQAFGWRGNSMPDQYIEHSVSNRSKIYNGIVSELLPETSNSNTPQTLAVPSFAASTITSNSLTNPSTLSVNNLGFTFSNSTSNNQVIPPASMINNLTRPASNDSELISKNQDGHEQLSNQITTSTTPSSLHLSTINKTKNGFSKQVSVTNVPVDNTLRPPVNRSPLTMASSTTVSNNKSNLTNSNSFNTFEPSLSDSGISFDFNSDTSNVRESSVGPPSKKVRNGNNCEEIFKNSHVKFDSCTIHHLTINNNYYLPDNSKQYDRLG